MGDTFPKFRAAVVQAAPVYLDRDASARKAVRLIEEAAAHGAGLIAFPEVFIAGYPYWIRLDNPFHATPWLIELVKNAVEVPSPTTALLCDAARRAKAHVVIGINERPANTLGTVFNTNLVIGPGGEILLRHRKLMPTYAEKLVWGFGDGAGLRVLDTPLGRLGTLICGENANPLARFALMAQGEQVHVANFPALPGADSGGYDLAREIELRGANHAFEGKVFNLVVSAVIDQGVIERVADSDEKRRIMSGRAMSFTGIFAPGGRLVSEVIAPGVEGIAYADCDIEAVIGPKMRHDVAGHYNRFDIFRLHVDRGEQRALFDDRALRDDAHSLPGGTPERDTPARPEGREAVRD